MRLGDVIEVLKALSTAGWPSRLLTLEDWESLPETDGCHVEVAQGVVSMVPRPHPHHQTAVVRLWAVLDPALGADLVAVVECDVLLEMAPPTVRAPDVLVVTRAAYDRGGPRFEAADLLLAVEVVSPGSRRTDLVTKASEYAEAGVPAYWVVELGSAGEALTLTEHRLDVATYDVVATHRGEVVLTVAGTSVAVDLDALV